MESNCGGRLSYVSSQPVMIPCSRSLLSRDKRLPLGTWNQSGLQGVFLEINFLRLIHPDHPPRIQSDDVQRHRETVPDAGRTKTIHTNVDRQNQGTIPMPTFATKPWTASSTIQVEFPQKFMVGEKRQRLSELQFFKFPNPQSFLVWKNRLKTQVTTCSDFPSEAMLWIKEVEMVELKASRSVSGKNFANFEMLDAKIASARNKIQISQFKKKVSLEESPGSVSTKKTDRLHD